MLRRAAALRDRAGRRRGRAAARRRPGPAVRGRRRVDAAVSLNGLHCMPDPRAFVRGAGARRAAGRAAVPDHARQRRHAAGRPVDPRRAPHRGHPDRAAAARDAAALDARGRVAGHPAARRQGPRRRTTRRARGEARAALRSRVLVARAAPPAAAAPAAPPRFDPPVHRDAARRRPRRSTSGASRSASATCGWCSSSARPRRGDARLGGARRSASSCAARAPLRRAGRRGRCYASRRGAARPARFIPGAVARPRRAVAARHRSRRARSACRSAPLRWAVEARSGRRATASPDRGSLAHARRGCSASRTASAPPPATPLRPCRNPVAAPRRLPPARSTRSCGTTRRAGGCATLRRGPFEPCEFGVTRRRSSAGTFLLIGDSHAMHWRPRARRSSPRRGAGAASRSRAPAARSARRSRARPALGPGACARLHREALGWLRAHPEVDTVFVSNWAPPGSSRRSAAPAPTAAAPRRSARCSTGCRRA